MPRKSWREALATYANPATLALLLLGFAAGLPYMLAVSYTHLTLPTTPYV